MKKSSLVFLVLIFLFQPVIHAQEDSRNIAARIDRLVIQVQQLTDQQERLEQAQDGIVEEIKNLKVWVRKK